MFHRFKFAQGRLKFVFGIIKAQKRLKLLMIIIIKKRPYLTNSLQTSLATGRIQHKVHDPAIDISCSTWLRPNLHHRAASAL